MNVCPGPSRVQTLETPRGSDLDPCSCGAYNFSVRGNRNNHACLCVRLIQRVKKLQREHGDVRNSNWQRNSVSKTEQEALDLPPPPP